MSAKIKVGIPMGIYKIHVEKKIAAGFLKNPMGKFSFRMEGKKFHGKIK